MSANVQLAPKRSVGSATVSVLDRLVIRAQIVQVDALQRKIADNVTAPGMTLRLVGDVDGMPCDLRLRLTGVSTGIDIDAEYEIQIIRKPS